MLNIKKDILQSFNGINKISTLFYSKNFLNRNVFHIKMCGPSFENEKEISFVIKFLFISNSL